MQAAAPDGTKIPQSELIGVTVVLLTCSYRGEEFVRVGYYVNNDFLDLELCVRLPLPPPSHHTHISPETASIKFVFAATCNHRLIAV